MHPRPAYIVCMTLRHFTTYSARWKIACRADPLGTLWLTIGLSLFGACLAYLPFSPEAQQTVLHSVHEKLNALHSLIAP